MLSKSFIIAALAGSAAAFSPSVYMNVERRDVVKGGAAAAAVTPFLGSVKPAEAFMQKNSMAPVITVFDHQGCSRKNDEYRGPEAGGPDDDRLVKVAQTKIVVTESMAAKALNEYISFKGISMDGGSGSAPASAAKAVTNALPKMPSLGGGKKADAPAPAKKAEPKKEEKKGGLFGF